MPPGCVPADGILSATANAATYARDRLDTEITPDDLLLGALHVVARFGVADLGPLKIDVSDVPPVPAGSAGTGTRPRYSKSAANVFDRASAIARSDGETRVRLAHLLAALGTSESSWIRKLADRYGFDEPEWRAALAAWDRSNERPAEPTRTRGSLMTVDDAAEALGVHQQTIRGYIRSGKLPAYRIAGERSIRVFAADLYGLLEPVEPTASEEEE